MRVPGGNQWEGNVPQDTDAQVESSSWGAHCGEHTKQNKKYEGVWPPWELEVIKIGWSTGGGR